MGWIQNDKWYMVSVQTNHKICAYKWLKRQNSNKKTAVYDNRSFKLGRLTASSLCWPIPQTAIYTTFSLYQYPLSYLQLVIIFKPEKKKEKKMNFGHFATSTQKMLALLPPHPSIFLIYQTIMIIEKSP